MNIRESSYGYWSSTHSFLWVVVGATVSISTLTRVPYLMSQYGGSAFLLTYLLCAILFAVPLMLAEWILGRWSRDDVVAGMGHLAQAAQARRSWKAVGMMALAGAILVLSYYSVMAGWSMAYTFRMAGGAVSGLDVAQSRQLFLDLAQDPERSLSWHTLFMVAVCVVVAHGFKEGVERAAVRLVPAAMTLVVGLLVYAMAKVDIQPAWAQLMTPDFAKLGWRGVIEAMIQAFFTMSLGIGVMMNLGVYLPASAPIKRLAFSVLLINIAFSVVAGVALYALVLASDQSPVAGLALIFQIVPLSLPNTFGGTLFGVAFFLTLFLITLCSATVMLEPLTRYLSDRLRWTRVFAATSGALIIWYLGLGSLLSFNIWHDAELFGRTFFGWIQFLTINLLVPATALLICIFVGSIMPRELAWVAWGERNRRIFDIWFFMLRYPARISLIIILLYSTGLLDVLMRFWTG
ncbi:sodium-dependent transporter [Sinimarinibacterium sp. NLF-5-8]|uniref:sodium-dependent transporter n=1 Tax=Sinimarinibacterium sp. NLF-5-8 TaxID=2698684 RepID=UPI00137BB664|nr:sodium-dependent transporter [Sinimarinibacterium sp. NLF-5-8]QHS09420.1 sodium-dependent transporter [Sinimarinibacterium sp. NLF-5-8]